ncbi:MAG: thrombospondin type 3 repeat-containing protein, partial [Verrucomicrobiota bacterium]|nr:thrombospondin type 3 repeat-containing protein [Verrucomicrobiota bacterium]
DGAQIEAGNLLATGVTHPIDLQSDTDSDGLTLAQEGAYGTNPYNSDTDGDGFSDDFEVNTGYDPTSAADTPDSKIVIRTAVELDIYTAIGGVYRIEYTDAIESDVWITAEEGIIGNGDIIRRLYNTREYSDRFYRAIRTDQ